MWWSEVERFTDYNNGINNHGGVDDNPPLAITKTFYGVADTIGIKPYVFGIPGGSNGFPEATKAANEVYFIEKGG